MRYSPPPFSPPILRRNGQTVRVNISSCRATSISLTRLSSTTHGFITGWVLQKLLATCCQSFLDGGLHISSRVLVLAKAREFGDTNLERQYVESSYLVDQTNICEKDEIQSLMHSLESISKDGTTLDE